MSDLPTGVKPHDANVIAARAVLHAAHVPGVSQAALRSAELTYHQMVLGSATRYGLLASNARAALLAAGIAWPFTVALADGATVTVS